MTEKEIVKKAIKKAEQNDYSSLDSDYFTEGGLWEMIIFSHDFAKAFFGEEDCHELCPCNLEYTVKKQHFTLTGRHCENMEDWEFHLQQMVLTKEPLKYLEKYL